MAKRYSGSLQINVIYNDHGYYRTSVSSGGKLLWSGRVNPAPSGFGPGVAYDSPKAYDEVASSAIAFADDEVGGIADEADYDEDLTGYLIRRKPSGKSARPLPAPTSSHARKKLDPHEAKQRLEAAGIDFSRDFHTLPSREVDLILNTAKAAGYRKSKGAPGSTARMYFQYMSRLGRDFKLNKSGKRSVHSTRAPAVSKDNTVYATTYCNQGHRMSDGKPVGHQCYVIPPEALRAERDGDYDRAIGLIGAARKLGNLYVHNGVRGSAKGKSSHATRHAGRKSGESWSGMCPTGKHGLDFKGQSCDLCKKTPPAQLNAEIKRALAGKGVRY